MIRIDIINRITKDDNYDIMSPTKLIESRKGISLAEYYWRLHAYIRKDMCYSVRIQCENAIDELDIHSNLFNNLMLIYSDEVLDGKIFISTSISRDDGSENEIHINSYIEYFDIEEMMSMIFENGWRNRDDIIFDHKIFLT